LGFASLFAPAVVAIAILLLARQRFPRPKVFEISVPRIQTQGLPRRYWFYIAATMCVALGYADFPLIAFHVQQKRLLSSASIPLLYALAMGIDALAAMLAGKLYDKQGVGVLGGSILLSAFFAPLVFLSHSIGIWMGMVLWGVGMGVQESVLRAMVAELVPLHRRGTGYGVFNTFFGFAWFAGSTFMGFLYQFSIVVLVVFAVAMQLLAVGLMIRFMRLGGTLTGEDKTS